MKSRILGMIMACAVIVLSVWVPVRAEQNMEDGNFTYRVNNGEATVVGCRDNNGRVDIPEYLGGYPVTAIGDSLFGMGLWRVLNAVTLPDSIKTIGSEAFRGCGQLTEIKLPKNLEYIGDYAFGGCSGIKEIKLPDKIKTIGEKAFSSCTNLESIQMPDSNIEIGKNAFNDTKWYDDRADGPVYLGRTLYKYKGEIAENTSLNVKEGTYAISDNIFSCDTSNLTELTLPQGLVKIGDTAFAASGIKSLVIPDSVTYIGESAFSGCENLSSIKLGSGLKELGLWVFSSCLSLTEITIPDQIVSIGGTFSGCTNLETINISPDSKLIKIPANALTDTRWYKDLPDGQVYISKVFCGYKGTVPEAVTLEEGTRSIASSALYGAKITAVTIPDSVMYIGDGAFWRCTMLEEIDIPDNVEAINENAFTDCQELKRVKLPKNLKVIGYCAFLNCSALGEIDLPRGLTEIGGSAFEKTGLKSVVIPEGVTEIGAFAFNKCADLESVTIPESVKELDNITTFAETNLKEVVIPDGFEKLYASTFMKSPIEKFTFTNSVKYIDWNWYMYDKVYLSIKNIDFYGNQRQWDEIEIHDDRINTLKNVNVNIMPERGKYAIKYDANGGRFDPEILRVVPDTEVTVTDDEPVKNGYVFAGWSASKAADAAEYHGGDKIKIGLDDVTLYAVWDTPKIIAKRDGNKYAITALGLPDGGAAVLAFYEDDILVDLKISDNTNKSAVLETNVDYDNVKLFALKSIYDVCPMSGIDTVIE